MAHPRDIKPDPYRPPTREQIDLGRSMYIENFTVSRCLAATDMSLGTFYYWLDGGPVGEDGKRMLPPIPRRRKVVGKRRRPLKTDRVSLAARLWRTTERQLRDIEERLARPVVGASAGPERERDVRILASLTRTLRDLAAFERVGLGAGLGQKEADKAAAPGVAAGGAPPQELDAYRLDLMRRLDHIVAEAQMIEEDDKEPAAG